jgi:hypothetical protein
MSIKIKLKIFKNSIAFHFIWYYNENIEDIKLDKGKLSES